MTDLLNTYEKSFKKNNDIIESNFNKIDSYFSSNINDSDRQKAKINKSYLLDEIDRLIEEQQKILKQMEIEICSLINRNDYDEFSSKLSTFKKTVALNKKKYNELYLKDESKNNSSENILLSETDSNFIRMFRRNEKLQQVKRSLSSTESIGTDIIVNMDNQTQNMKNITGKIKGMGKDLNDSNNILNKMKKRTKKNKYIIIFFVVAFILILLSIIGIKLYNKYK